MLIIYYIEVLIIELIILQLPYGVNVSDHCRDLLLQLLKRHPDERISFDEFFVHPFLDLQHMPSHRCLPTAVSIFVVQWVYYCVDCF